MTDLTALPTPTYISSYTTLFAAGKIRAEGLVSALAARNWPTANMAFFYPFAIPYRYRVKRMFTASGTVAGNWSVGIYDSKGAGIYVSSGFAATIGAGTSGLEYHTPASPFSLPPGKYYFGVSNDGTTNRGYGNNVSNSTWLGVRKQASAYPLPASATMVDLGSEQMWQLCGFTRI